MKKISYFVLITLVVCLSVACRTVREIKNLAKCDFRMTTTENTNISGVNVQNVQSYGELNMLDVAQILTVYQTTKGVPLGITLNVEARNPNDKLAAMNFMEWIAEIDGMEIARGVLDKRIEVAPSGGTAIFPIKISADLVKVFSSKQGQDAASKGLGLSDGNSRPTRLTLKIKPSISIGKGFVKYPGYIKLNKDF